MKKIHIKNIDPGCFTTDKPFYERLLTFNNGMVDITDTSITFKSKENKIFTSLLEKVNQNNFKETFIGKFEGGEPFRFTRAERIRSGIKEAEEDKNNFSISDVTWDGYSIRFMQVDINEPDIKDIEREDIVFSIDSKAETLVMSANSLKNTNPQLAKVHISRFMNILQKSNIEILKFNEVFSIAHGYLLASDLALIDDNAVTQKIRNLALLFLSSNHLRYENNQLVSDSNKGSFRVIEILPNFKENDDGFIVTIYNQNNLDIVRGQNVQLTSKKMRVVNKSGNIIYLKGFGYDNVGVPFENYALTVCLHENEINYITLHLLYKGVDIKYIK